MHSGQTGSGASPGNPGDFPNSESPLLTARTLILALTVVARAPGFVAWSEAVFEGETHHFDVWLQRPIGRDDDPAVPIGPSRLREAGLDITALGSPVILVLLIRTVLGIMHIRENAAKWPCRRDFLLRIALRTSAETSARSRPPSGRASLA